MSEPERIVDVQPSELHPYHPPCSKCGDPCEQLVRPGRPIMYTGLCRTHGELEFSERWQKRWAKAEGAEDQKRLLDERKRWELSGHTYRGVSEREDYAARRAP